MKRSLLYVAGFTSLLCVCLAPCRAQEHNKLADVSNGEVSKNTYHNQQLSFSYQFPAGWVVGKATVAEHMFGWKDEPTGKASTGKCSKDLLFATQHPEGMRPDGFVPMVSLFLVDPGCLPGVMFPKSVGDREAVEQVVNSVEARLQTPTSAKATLPRVRPVEYAGRTILQISQSMIARIQNTTTTTNETLQLTISIVPVKEFWAIWLMVTANDAEMSRLKATKIFFDEAFPSTAVPNKQ
jgi:hypothetical protein